MNHLEAAEVIAKALNDDDVEYVWNTAETILAALEEAGFSTTREQGRYEQVGWLERQAAYLPWKTFTLEDASDNDHYEPVFRRVDGDFE